MFDKLDKVLLGHNQFYGINHRSMDKADQTGDYFKNIQNVVDIIEYASKLGVNSMMLSTHENVNLITKSIDHSILKTNKLNYYPLLPYMRKYLNLYNTHGYFGSLLNILKRTGISQNLKFSLRLLNPLSPIYEKLMKSFIDIEIAPFMGKNTKVIFLHNILTDFLVAMGMTEVLISFSKYIKSNFNCEPGFCTVNFPNLVKVLNSVGLNNSIIMAPFNKVGYQMNPTKTKCEEVLSENPQMWVIAMSTLASGAINPKEAYGYLFSDLQGINSVVVGVSTKVHAEETFSLLNKYL
mgnify:CR=1 FL=1|tara:strand:- start:521 stop:1402 length:882 start_codon:yes stop_codon:yes gene_type:complete